MQEEIDRIYGSRLRVRVCGLLCNDDRLLLVNHRLEGRTAWWAPPGGGVEFGEPLEQALRREFKEETNLRITVGQFAFGCEYLHEPLHAIELYFWVTQVDGVIRPGDDPEMSLITDVRFMKTSDVACLPRDQKHGIFHAVQNREDLLQLKGFYRI